eukprot:CAMPEP_0175190292 /NCGR_PEP_ID=MMETSP0093-20121207/4361_1 /TAXON_ID=311494 /ORGANISM="Alexandrium monilatum, Strain CCMP3105" /LENGTH=61 /DNA_ID=CAMNT_0016483099 /DNA_START=367 /DNA_END=552 /DNA_ORIENTATION=+
MAFDLESDGACADARGGAHPEMPTTGSKLKSDPQSPARTCCSVDGAGPDCMRAALYGSPLH